MTKRIVRIISLTLALLIIASMFGCAAPATPAATKAVEATQPPAAKTEAPAAQTQAPAAGEGATIKIGLDLPTSGGGGLEGQNVSRGAELAVDEINAKGGINGHKLELVIGDNQCDSAVGVSAIRKLIEVDKVDVTMGSSCSSVTLAVMPILQETKTASLDVTATNPGISAQSGPKGGNLWKFRLNLNDLLMNEEFAKRVIAKEANKVALMVTNTDYGRGVVDVLKGVIPDKIVTEEYFALGDADFRPQLTRIKGLNPDAILIIGDFSEASKIVNQMYELGMKQKIYGRGSVVTDNTMELLSPEAKPLMEGAKEVVFFALTDETNDLAARYKAKFNETMNRDNGMGYFGLQVLAEAIKNCGTITGDLAKDRQCIRDGLEKVNMDIPALGHIQFDQNYQAHYPMFITTIKDGKAVVIERVPTE